MEVALSIIVYSESSKVELPWWMTQKLLQHGWSHFLRDLLNRCLQFHSYLCHHAGCFPTVAFPSEFQGLQKQKKEEEKTKTNQAPMHPSQKKKEYLQMENGTIMPILMEKLPNIATKTCRKFLRSVYCKPQAAFLGCVLTGLAQQDPEANDS